MQIYLATPVVEYYAASRGSSTGRRRIIDSESTVVHESSRPRGASPFLHCATFPREVHFLTPSFLTFSFLLLKLVGIKLSTFLAGLFSVCCRGGKRRTTCPRPLGCFSTSLQVFRFSDIQYCPQHDCLISVFLCVTVCFHFMQYASLHLFRPKSLEQMKSLSFEI